METGYSVQKFLLGHAVLQLETVGYMCNISTFRPLICRVLSLPRTAPGSRISARSSVALKQRGAEFSKWIITCRAAPSPPVCRARKRATWFRSSKRLSSYYREELEPSRRAPKSVTVHFPPRK